MTRRIITTNDIAALMQKRVQCGDKIAGSFLHELSQVVALALATDGYLNIDGLGVFRATTDVDGKPNVEFAPAESLATSVNVQFSIFEPVELADDVTEKTLEEAPVPEPVSMPEPEIAAEKVDKEEPETEQKPEPEPEPESESEPEFEPEQKPEQKPEVQPTAKKLQTVNEALGARTIRIETPPTIKFETPADPLPVRVEQREPMPVRVEHDQPAPSVAEGHSNLTLIFAAVAALLLGVIIGLTVGYGLWHTPSVSEIPGAMNTVGADQTAAAADNATAADTVEIVTIDAEKVEVNAATADSIAAAREAALRVSSTAVVTDTVRAGNFLTKMARRHYGDSNFWIYIYLENKDKIADPDNLPDGLVVTVPPAAKYGIDAADKESVRKAEQLAWTTSQP